MMEIKVGLDSAPTFLAWFKPLALYIYEERAVYLSDLVCDRIVEYVVNHETLHDIIGMLEGKKIAYSFDKLFPHLDISNADDVLKYVDEFGLPKEKSLNNRE